VVGEGEEKATRVVSSACDCNYHDATLSLASAEKPLSPPPLSALKPPASTPPPKPPSKPPASPPKPASAPVAASSPKPPKAPPPIPSSDSSSVPSCHWMLSRSSGLNCSRKSGISCLDSIRILQRSSPMSSLRSLKKEVALPSLPIRAVRPIRWTYSVMPSC
jgi:hypothetical protein